MSSGKRSWWLIPGYGLLLFLLGLSLYTRTVELGRSAYRSDEINQYQMVIRGQSIIDLWKNPPWMNQIPAAEVVAILASKIIPASPNEWTIRIPFAAIGFLTVLVCVVVIWRRAGLLAAVILAGLMALNPFHVYQSREAYYYILSMFFTSGSFLLCLSAIQHESNNRAITRKDAFVWGLWATLACHMHMSVWIVIGVQWLVMLIYGWRSRTGIEQIAHVQRIVITGVIILFIMSRWIYRALTEVFVTSAERGGHIAFDFWWVTPRLLPVFFGGINWVGIGLLLILILASVYYIIRFAKSDDRFRLITLLTFACLTGSFLYVGLVGGGGGKFAYFSPNWPSLMIWASLLLSGLWNNAKSRHDRAFSGCMLGASAVLILALASPVQAIIRLDGKPVPYKLIRDWLDHQLDPGSVAVVDRWYDPWNEMAVYTPTNVTVTFTVPDEPYENYVQLRWREVTQQAIESGKFDAFIRITRNHEERAGLWTWPETYFARQAVVKNASALWLREHGYAASEDFYSSNSNRVIVDIFYDLREDALARKRAAGEQFGVFFNQTIPYEKSGPMGIFRFQTQQFMDWRALGERGELEVYNLTDAPADVTLQISAVAPREAKAVSSNGKRFQFPAGQMQQWNLGPLTLAPGRNVVAFEDPRWGPSQSPLLISSVEVK